MRAHPSPVDLDAPPLEAHALGWTSAVIATATAALLLVNAVALRDWVDDLPPGPIQAHASEMANTWVELSERIGVGVPRRWLHERWKALESARF